MPTSRWSARAERKKGLWFYQLPALIFFVSTLDEEKKKGKKRRKEKKEG